MGVGSASFGSAARLAARAALAVGGAGGWLLGGPVFSVSVLSLGGLRLGSGGARS